MNESLHDSKYKLLPTMKVIRASPLGFLGRCSQREFFVRTPKIGPVAFRGLRFRLDLDQVSSRIPRPIPGRGNALGTPDEAKTGVGQPCRRDNPISYYHLPLLW